MKEISSTKENPPSTATRFLANTTNFISGPFWGTVKTFGHAVIPAALGAIGGRLTGAGWQMGMLQGVAGTLLCRSTIMPIGKYVLRNEGTEPGQFNDNSIAMLSSAGLVVQYVVPVLITKNFGGPILAACGSKFPLLIPQNVADYTFKRGLLNNIAPALAETSIGALRELERYNKGQ